MGVTPIERWTLALSRAWGADVNDSRELETRTQILAGLRLSQACICFQIPVSLDGVPEYGAGLRPAATRLPDRKESDNTFRSGSAGTESVEESI